jgi:hypothetical protein
MKRFSLMLLSLCVIVAVTMRSGGSSATASTSRQTDAMPSPGPRPVVAPMPCFFTRPPTTVTLTRELPTNSDLPRQVTITVAAQVQKLYRQLCALHNVEPTSLHCNPGKRGSIYDLSFIKRVRGPTLTVRLVMNGCHFVTASIRPSVAIYRATHGLDLTVAGMLGVTVARLYR